MTKGENEMNGITGEQFIQIALQLAGGMKAIGAGLAVLGMFGPGVGVGLAAYGAFTGMARNPEIKDHIGTQMIIALAFAEAIAIYAFVSFFLLKP